MESIGEVVALSGDVRALFEGGERVLAQGSPIQQGETIITAEGSTVQIRLADESVLAQGENASQTIDHFIYDPDSASGSNMLIDMAQGTFRMVTGKVGESNPEGVAVKTPLATIGIRGTGIDLDVQGALTKIGCFLYDGLDVTVTGEQGTRILNAVNTILDVLADGTFGEIRTYSEFEKAFFKAAAPILGIPEDQLYGGEGEEGQEGSGDENGGPDGDGDNPDGEDGGEQDGEDDAQEGEGETNELAELFQELFGTEENPSELLETLFSALAAEGGDTLAGGAGEDTLGEEETDPDELITPAQQTGDQDDDHDNQGTGDDDGWTGNEDGSSFDTSNAEYVRNGTNGDDNLYAETHTNEVIFGDEGNDTLSGSDDGLDTLFGGSGNDYLMAGAGNDLLIGGTGDDEMYGESGADEMYGGNGKDTMDGGSDDDTMDGGNDSDVLIGGDGKDVLTGGNGGDYYLATHSGSNADFEDIYKDFDPTEDTLILDISKTNWTDGTETSLNSTFFVSSLTYADYAADPEWTDVSGAYGTPLILSADGKLFYDENHMNSGFGNTAEQIGDFSDGNLPDAGSIKVAKIVTGDNYGEYLSGSNGLDFILGLDGDDTIIGGGKSDTLSGGSGADTYQYSDHSDAGDIILDFVSGEDSFMFFNSGSAFKVCTASAGDPYHPVDNASFFSGLSGAYEDTAGEVSSGGYGFVFDDNGDLWYDPSFADANDAIRIATVEGEVTADDINISDV